MDVVLAPTSTEFIEGWKGPAHVLVFHTPGKNTRATYSVSLSVGSGEYRG